MLLQTPQPNRFVYEAIATPDSEPVRAPRFIRWPSVCGKRFHMMDRLGYGYSTFGPRRMRNATRANDQKSPLFSLAGFAATPTTSMLYFQPPHFDFCSQSVSNARLARRLPNGKTVSPSFPSLKTVLKTALPRPCRN